MIKTLKTTMKEKRNKKKETLGGIGKKVMRFCRISFCLALVVALSSVETTSSFFSDIETSSISMEAGTLEMELRSGQSNFSPSSRADNLKPGESIARDIYVGKTGSLPLRYGATVQKDPTCDTNLFEGLNLRVYYNFYHTQNPEYPSYHQYRTMKTVYDGKLSDFALNDSVPNDDDLQIPNANPHFNNRFYEENEHWLYFRVELPVGAADSLQNKNCAFDFNFESWQTSNSDSTSGFHDKASLSNGITTNIWVEPETPNPLGWNTRSTSNSYSDVPVGIACGGITNGDFPTEGNGSIAFLWEEVMYPGFTVTYEKQWLRPGQDPNNEQHWAGHEMWTTPFTNFRTFGSSAGTEGLWFNRVRSLVDADLDGIADLKSDWGAGCSITYDKTAPDVEIKSPLNSETVSGTIPINGDITDLNPHHFWLVIQDSTGHKVAGPGVVNETSSLTDNDLFIWDTTTVANGTYTIKLEARDAANNKDAGSVHWIEVEVDNQAGADTTPPTVDFVSPEEQDTVSGVLDIKGDVADANPKEYWVRIEDAITGLEVVAYPKHQSLSSFLSQTVELWDTTSVFDGPYTIELHAEDQAGNQNSDKVTVLVNNNNPAPPMPLAPEKAEDFVVLNEFLPDPEDSDKEFVELYNNSNSTEFDLADWYINDETTWKLVVSDSTTVSGSTKISKKGFLVLEISTSKLNNSGDTVKLFDPSDQLIDEYRYEASEVLEGKTIARIPDGIGAWVDPVPTPGKKNNPDASKEALAEYYLEKCFDNDKPICEEDFMRNLGIYPEEEERVSNDQLRAPGASPLQLLSQPGDKVDKEEASSPNEGEQTNPVTPKKNFPLRGDIPSDKLEPEKRPSDLEKSIAPKRQEEEEGDVEPPRKEEVKEEDSEKLTEEVEKEEKKKAGDGDEDEKEEEEEEEDIVANKEEKGEEKAEETKE